MTAKKNPNADEFESNIYKLDSYSFALILIFICLKQTVDGEKVDEIQHD